MFKSLVQLQLIFGIAEMGSRFILLFLNMEFAQQYVWEKLPILQCCVVFAPLLKISCLSIGCVLGSLFCFVDLCDYYHDPKHAILITIIFKCHASCYVVLSRFLLVCVWVCVYMCMYICV